MTFGARAPRKEDERLIRGEGQFVGDYTAPDMVHAYFLRSPLPHAAIQSIDVSTAKAMRGVVSIFTAADIKDLPPVLTPLSKDAMNAALVNDMGLQIRPFHMPLLAEARVLRQGQPVAVAIASDPRRAEDAAKAIEVTYQALPAVMDPMESLAADAPILFEGASDNIHGSFRLVDGDVDGAFAQAPHRISVRLRFHRSIGVPIECRSTFAAPDPSDGSMIVRSTHQRPHVYRTYLAELLGVPDDSLHVATPDMGGGFGGNLYPEELLIPCLAHRLGVPVRWVEDRRENLENARHSRDQIHDLEIAFDSDGAILALRDDIVVDYGVFNPFGVATPYNTTCHLRGQYRIAACDVRARAVYTNKTANTVVRGAGRPEAAFAMERAMDLVARQLDLDPADVRRRNLIPADAMPYPVGIPFRDGKPMMLDTGDYPAQLESALSKLDLAAARELKASLRREGRRIGIGIGSYVEGSGYGPPEVALAKLTSDGFVIHSGSAPHGQSHETTLAQVAADALGVPFDAVVVRAGDTDLVEGGTGTFASRSAVYAGSAVHNAASELKGAILEAAAARTGVDVETLTIADDGVIGAEGRVVAFADLAAEGLERFARFAPKGVTFASGTHVAVVEVDQQTGRVEIIRYVVAHECGRMINPTVVEGQIVGGAVHGIGNALYEEVKYSPEGRLLTDSLFSYLLPTATEIPRIEIVHQEFPTPLNPIGVKGCGEGGAVGSCAAIANAVEDALADLGVQVTELPLTPPRVLGLIERARSSR